MAATKFIAAAAKKSKEIRMASSSNETKISLQVGSELRIKNNGDS